MSGRRESRQPERMARFRESAMVAMVWWPAAIAGLFLLAGLIALGASPGAASEPVVIYAAGERPSPIPLDPEGDHLVDLNRASPEELAALPGIGATRAEALIRARDEAPFQSAADVAERGVLPASLLVELDGFASVRPPTAEPEP